MGFQYDAASNRTRVTWPDANYVQYTYDALNRMDQAGLNGAFSGGDLIADYAYDALGRREGLARGNGTATVYGYDPASRLTALSHDMAGTAKDQALGFVWTPASQLFERSESNALYGWTDPGAPRTYARNGLNQYTAVSGTPLTYDPRGNPRVSRLRCSPEGKPHLRRRAHLHL